MSLFDKGKTKQMIELQNQYDSLTHNYALLKQECTGYKQTISAFVGVKTGYEDEVQKIKQAHALETQNLKLELEKEKKAVARKVNKALADIGVREFAAEEISVNHTNDTPEAVYSKFMALKGEEKAKFFKANETTLTKMANGH